MKTQSYIPRTWIIFLQVIGTAFSVIGVGFYIAYMSQISDAIMPNEPLGKITTAAILAVLVYFTWKAIYTSAVIIRYMQQATDLEISNNRFIISALSLNLGGFATPFIMTALPNVEVQSTINPRYFLSKVMGITTLVGSAIALITFFSAIFSGFGALSQSQAFDPTNGGGIITIVFLVVSLVILIFGGLTTGLFYATDKSKNILETQNNTYGGTLKFIAGIWMGIITIELALVIWFAVIRLLGAIVDFFEAMNQNNGMSGFFYMLLSMMNIFITMLYTWWVVLMTVATIKGLWQEDGIHYKEYDGLARQQQRTF